MLCLDTYVLIELRRGNPKFSAILNKEFVITDLTIAEFYVVLYKEKDEKSAEYLYDKLEIYCKPVSRSILIKALKYREENKKDNLSIFDAAGYIFSIVNNLKFVTGDKAFKDKEGVEFIQK